MKYLFTAEDSFQLESLGCVIVTTFPMNESFPILKVGDAIILETLEGNRISSIVQGIPMINYGRIPNRLHFSIQLPSNLKKEDVPVGTKVFIEN